MLTGFAFAGMAGAAGSDAYKLSIIYLAVTAISMGFGLLVVTTSSMVSLKPYNINLITVIDLRLTTSINGRASS